MRGARVLRRSAVAIAALSLFGVAQPWALARAGTPPAPMSAMDGPPAHAARGLDRARLDLLREVVAAGGGAAHFRTVTFVGTLTDQPPEIELARLTGRFGAANVKTFVAAFDGVVADTLRSRELDSIGAGTAADGERKPKLAAALYAAGIDPRTRTFDVETLLDRLLSPRLHMQTMMHVTRVYGPAADATYHLVLARLVRDAATTAR